MNNRGDAGTYLDFCFLAYALPLIPARQHFDNPNLALHTYCAHLLDSHLDC